MHSTSGQPPPHRSKGIAGMMIVGVVGCLGVAMAVPWLFPTETLWYKAGADKLMLLAAQLIGLLTLVLLLLQILLGLRPAALVQAFGSAFILRLHRGNGALLAAGALGHALLVLVPEGLANLPLGWKFWPELVGAASLFCLVVTVMLSWWRAALGLAYQRWHLLHRLLAALLPALLAVHVLFVSDSFARGVPRAVLLTGVVLLYLFAALLWMSRNRIHSTRNSSQRSP